MNWCLSADALQLCLLATQPRQVSGRPSMSMPFLKSHLTRTICVSPNRLRKLGFTEDTSEGAPLCRWQQGDVKLDVMPLDEKILGFSNRWYVSAMATAQAHELEPDLRIR